MNRMKLKYNKLKIKASKFYNRLQSIPDGSSESEWSDDEDLYTPLLPQDRCVVSDTDDDIPTNGDYLVIPASDDEIASEDENDVPLSIRLSRLVSNKSKKAKEPKPVWLEENYITNPETITFTGDTTLPENILSLTDPYQFFSFLFPSTLIQYITDQTNIYASQISPNKLPNICVKEIEQFIGICLKMSVCKLPSVRHHWGNLGTPSIYNVMSVNRFEEIKRFINFNDNSKLPERNNADYDKLYKVRALCEQILNIIRSIPKEEHLAVDEQIIPTKSRTSLKQYNPKKPHKCCYKVFVLSGVSGFCYDFDIFAGAQSNIIPNSCPNMSVSSNVVLRMNGVTIIAVSWLDNKIVNMVSTYAGSQPVIEKKRFFKSENRHKIITCPNVVGVYNSYMGGVDLIDSMLGYYRIPLSSKKYYMKIFYHLIDLCVVNAWLLYRRVHPSEPYLSLVDFKILISEVLCEMKRTTPKRKGRPTAEENRIQGLIDKKKKRGPCTELPAEDVRLDGMDHYPFHDKRSRCKYPTCKNKTLFYCTKCQLPLCINDKRNCFLLFHTQ
ncbi:unnamed protein product [Macrosiphum euphorbiae]|uniref:PiggyBac transposable element-derived protein domain-containing protein n=1 Tax=Macrosiphum euphorbiae TaxID=13131 RepID=A0AAV0WB01_9HEMI|nr:unnamed protein product [Macrosiphum euphorbiae]